MNSRTDPVHTFGGMSAPGGPPGFGPDVRTGPHAFGAQTPASSQWHDMGNQLTERQSARIVVQPHDIKDKATYKKQVECLVEREFAMIFPDSTPVLNPSSAPGDYAVVTSLPYINSRTLDGDAEITSQKALQEDIPQLPVPFGAVIQTLPANQGARGGHAFHACNIGVGGRTTHSNIYIKMNNEHAVNIGDPMYVVTVLLHNAKDGDFFRGKPFHFIVMDNDHSCTSIDVSKCAPLNGPTAGDWNDRPWGVLNNPSMGALNNASTASDLTKYIRSCTANPSETLKFGNGGYMTCVSKICVGVLIEMPIQIPSPDWEIASLQAMINTDCKMSTAQPLVVQMST